jgi:hypothetical protein
MRRSLRHTWAAFLLLAACGDGDEGRPTAALGGPEPPPAGSDPSRFVFDESELNDFHLTLAPADWESILQDTMGDTYRTATLRWKDVTLSPVGVRPSGSSSRYPGNPKMSLRFDFDVFVSGRKFMGLKSLKLDGLRETTMMRDSLSYWVFRAFLPATPRTAYCRLFVNGEYRGAYMAEERVTGDLVRNRYGGEDGNLYRLRVDRPEAFAYRGADPSLYLPEPWEPETNERNGDHSAIPRFLDILNHRPSELGSVCDLENLTHYLALEAVVISRDGLLRNAGPPHNVQVYHRPATGRFELIPWDLDQSWAGAEVTRDIFHNFGNTRLAAVVRDTPTLRALYISKIARVLDREAHPDRVAARIDFQYARIRQAVYEDPYKHITNAQFDGYPDYLKRVARDRAAFLRTQVSGP